MTVNPNSPELEYLFSYVALLQAPEVIGPVPEGIRVNFYVKSGTIRGPRLSGTLSPAGGGDWLTIRRDGMAVLDVRITLRADDGAQIYMTYPGVGDLGTDGYERFLRGEMPATLALRTAPTFRTAAPQYAWLHRVLCISTGEVDFGGSEVRYDVFAVR
jgi:hypothetical protein